MTSSMRYDKPAQNPLAGQSVFRWHYISSCPSNSGCPGTTSIMKLKEVHIIGWYLLADACRSYHNSFKNCWIQCAMPPPLSSFSSKMLSGNLEATPLCPLCGCILDHCGLSFSSKIKVRDELYYCNNPICRDSRSSNDCVHSNPILRTFSHSASQEADKVG